MDSLKLALSVVLPLLIYILTGIFVRKTKILKEDHFRALNRMIFKIMIPLALFFSIYRADFRKAVDLPLFIACETGVLITFFVVRAIVFRSLREGAPVAATLTQGIYRSNFVLFGVTIAGRLCDSDGVAVVAAMSAVIVPTFNILAVILFESIKGENVTAGKLILEIFKNPLVDAGLLGVAVGCLGIRIPGLIAEPLATLGDAATPVALVVLGGLLTAESVSSHRRCLIIATAGRLVLVPAAALSLAVLFGFRGADLVAVLAVFGSPTAVASTPMAQAMGGDVELAGEIVAFTTIFSILSIFLWVTLLSAAGLICGP